MVGTTLKAQRRRIAGSARWTEIVNSRIDFLTWSFDRRSSALLPEDQVARLRHRVLSVYTQ